MPSDNASQALASEGTLLQISDGASPPNWTTIANVGDINGPQWSSTVVDVTSHSSQAPFRQKIVTLLDIGQVTAKVFWVPTNDTHRNAPTGLRYVYLNRLKKTWRLRYTDGVSFDEFDAYITKLGEVATVAGVYEMTVTWDATGYPENMV